LKATPAIQSPVPNRLFRKPYDYAGPDGKSTGDWEKYWNFPGLLRQRYFTWDWQKQDFPHPNGQPWVVPGPADLPTFKAHAWVWFRPTPDSGTHYSWYPNHYLFNNTLMGYYLKPMLPEAFLMPLRYQVPEFSILPHPPQLQGRPPLIHLLLHTLAAGRPVENIQDYLWQNPPEDSAIIGLVIKRFNAANGDIGDAMPSVMAAGPVLNTTRFAAAQLDEQNLYVFGGKTLNADLSSTLWHGWLAQDGEGQDIFLWESLAEGGPAGRRGAVLVADPERNRLLLLMGHTTTGRVIDAWSYSLDSHAWTQEVIQVPGLPPATKVAFAAANGKLYLYGGRDGGTFYEGLYEIDLATLSGERLDLISDPGPRAAAALYYNPQTEMLYLHGGRDEAGLRGDLWIFDLGTRTWELVSDPGMPGAPPAMLHTAIAICPHTGAINVLAGQQENQPAPEAMWRLRLGLWQTHSEITGGTP